MDIKKTFDPRTINKYVFQRLQLGKSKTIKKDKCTFYSIIKRVNKQPPK